MASTTLFVFLVVALSGCLGSVHFAAPAAAIAVPHASSYSAHVINHSVAAPVAVAAPILARAAPLIAHPHSAPLIAHPHSASLIAHPHSAPLIAAPSPYFYPGAAPYLASPYYADHAHHHASIIAAK